MLSAGLLFARLTGALKAVPWQVWAGLVIIAAVLLYGSHREAQGYAEAEASSAESAVEFWKSFERASVRVLGSLKPV